LREAGVTRELLAEAFDVDPKTITAAGSYLMAHLKQAGELQPEDPA
jgi:hypothetical protein